MKTPESRSPDALARRRARGWCLPAGEMGGAGHRKHGRAPLTREPQGAEGPVRGRRGHVWPGEARPSDYADGTAEPGPGELSGYR